MSGSGDDPETGGRGAVALFTRTAALVDAVEVALEMAEIPAWFIEDPDLLDGPIGAALIDLRDFPDAAALCESIRARAGQGTPIFLLTTPRQSIRTRDQAHEAGADDLFEMPVAADQVLALLTMVLDRAPPTAPLGIFFGAEVDEESSGDVESFDGDPEQLSREAALQGLQQNEAALSDVDARARELDELARLEALAAEEEDALEAETWEVWTHHDAETRARLEAARRQAEVERAATERDRDEALARADTLERRHRDALEEERLRLAALEAERTRDRERVETLAAELDEARGQQAFLAAELEKVHDERAALNAAADALAEERDRLAGDKDALRAELQRTREERDRALADVEDARQAAEEVVAEERARRESSSRARDEAVRELRSVSAELDEQERARALAEEERDQLRAELNAAQDRSRELAGRLARVEEDRDAALTELERVTDRLNAVERERDDLQERTSDARSREAEKLREEIERLRAALDEERAAAVDERRSLDERVAEALSRERELREDAERRALEAARQRDRERVEAHRLLEGEREKARLERHALAEARASIEADLRGDLEAAREREAELIRVHEAELAEVERREAEARTRRERELRRSLDEELERRVRALDEERADEERRYRQELAEELRAEIEARLEREAEAARLEEESRRRAREQRARAQAERDQRERDALRQEQEAALESERREVERKRAALEEEIRNRAAFSTGLLESMLVEDAKAAFSGGDAGPDVRGDVGSVPYPEGEVRAVPAGGARFPVDNDDEIEPPPAPARFVPMEPRDARFHVGEVAAALWSAHTLGISGALELTDGSGHARTVFFERGEPVGFASELPRDRPEEFLLSAGLITKAGYNRMRAGPHLSARRACARLVDEDELKPEELFTAVRGVFTEQLLTILEWETGAFTYRELSSHPADRLRLTRRLDAVLAEGVRRKFDEDRLWRALGGPRTILGPDDRALRLPAFLPEEVESARLFDGTRSLQDIILDTGAEPHVVLRVGLALVSARAARVIARGVPMSQEEREARAERSLEIDRGRIRDRVHIARHGDYFEFLGVREDATPQEIRHSASRLRDRFAPRRYQAPEFADLRGALEEIAEVSRDAETVLTDEELRRGYAARVQANRARKRALLEDTGGALPH